MKILLSCMFICSLAFAETYYVRTDGNNGNPGTANSSGGAWLTIDYAADNTSAGDIVRVQAGGYSETLTPSASGSDGNTITFIADGNVILRGINFDGTDSYIRYVGFDFDNNYNGGTPASGVILFGSNHTGIEFWNCAFHDATYQAIRVTSGSMTKCLFIANEMFDLGIGNYSGTGIAVRGTNNIVAYNELYDIDPDAFAMFGRGNRFLNNYVHNLLEEGGGHPDVYQTGTGPLGWSDHLIEATFYVAAGIGGNEHSAQLSNGQTPPDGGMTNNIFRGNIFHNMGSGGIGINQTETGPIAYIYVYNNNVVDALRAYPTTRYADVFSGDNTDYIWYLNNLLHEAWGTSATVNLEAFLVEDFSTYVADYNLAYDPDGNVTFATFWTAQANEQSNADPDFIDYDNDNFRLGAESAATGSAGPLTAVNDTAGTGTEFDVDNAGFFRGDNTAISQYEGNLIVGDKITVGTDQLTIASISGNTITVTSSFTWADNDPVYFGWDTTPDIGAYPFSHTPLTAATYLDRSNVYTVTPNGDTRFVVFFEDGIPQSVDNAPPYTYTSNGGAVVARAYPLYASKTTWVQATLGIHRATATTANVGTILNQ